MIGRRKSGTVDNPRILLGSIIFEKQEQEQWDKEKHSSDNGNKDKGNISTSRLNCRVIGAL